MAKKSKDLTRALELCKAENKKLRKLRRQKAAPNPTAKKGAVQRAKDWLLGEKSTHASAAPKQTAYFETSRKSRNENIATLQRASNAARGTIKASYETLVAVFGSPWRDEDAYKTHFTWYVTRGSELYEIYDYKVIAYEEGQPSVAEAKKKPSLEWDVAGPSKEGVTALKRYVQAHQRQRAQARRR